MRACQFLETLDSPLCLQQERRRRVAAMDSWAGLIKGGRAGAVLPWTVTT